MFADDNFWNDNASVPLARCRASDNLGNPDLLTPFSGPGRSGTPETWPPRPPAVAALLSLEELRVASEEQIRNHAHQLWEKAGRPEGRAAEFWRAAEAELNAEDENPDAANQPNRRTVPG